MPAGNRVAGPAQILGQILFHLDGGLIRHRIEMLIQFRQQAETVAFDHACSFNSCLVVGKALLWGQSRHSHINARLFGITPWVLSPDLPDLADGRVKQHNINVVVQCGLRLSAKLLEGPAFHFSKSEAAPTALDAAAGRMDTMAGSWIQYKQKPGRNPSVPLHQRLAASRQIKVSIDNSKSGDYKQTFPQTSKVVDNFRNKINVSRRHLNTKIHSSECRWLAPEPWVEVFGRSSKAG